MLLLLLCERWVRAPSSELRGSLPRALYVCDLGRPRRRSTVAVEGPSPFLMWGVSSVQRQPTDRSVLTARTLVTAGAGGPGRGRRVPLFWEGTEGI